MNYIIDGKVIYRSVDGTIRLLAEHESESVILTPLVNKIFAFLISHHGELVTRQQIFEEVWEKAGLIPSSHTLNQYISTIRRILSAYFDETEIIITIPKSGYIFSSEVAVSSEPFTKENIGANKIWVWGSIIAIILILVTFYRINTLIPQPQNVMGYIDNCSIMDISGANNHGDKAFEMGVAKSIAQLGEATCAPNTHFYFYAQESLHVKKKGGVMLAKCIEWKDSQNNCETIYVDDWDRK
jgi:DNA-binding winged helix-turn-helix (wHTH) protein